MQLAERIEPRPFVQSYPLQDAGQALEDLRRGTLHGAAVPVSGGRQPQQNISSACPKPFE